MIRSASYYSGRSEFDKFLYASIGEDNDEVPLSVLSALARLDIDPWAEAATLAALPQKTAAKRLAWFIQSLPSAAPLHQDAGEMAARLIVLLPHHAGPHFAARSILHAAPPSPLWTVKYVILIALMFGTQWAATSCQPLTLHNAFKPSSTVGPPPAAAPSSPTLNASP